MLKYKSISFALAAIASAIFAAWTSSEDYSAYFFVSGLVLGAITCLLISQKMMPSNKVKIDPKKNSMGDYGGCGEF